jgi:LuxR family transcriptional regulator, maltose regulon positive regulatory protein
MAERTAAPAGGDATGQDVLLATKLYVPRPPAGLVARPRLAEALADGRAGALVLVSAPAGFGKTALLAGWIRGEGRPAGWLSLDAGDNVPARFWRHAAAALDAVCPGISARVGPLLGPPSPASFQGPVTALINELAGAAGDDEVLLVLDDYHVIEAGAVHASVGFLLEHRPPGLRLVLASRSDPPLRLARLRARGQLTELRAADLRFTVDEAAALLRRAAGAELPGGSVAALAERTEGWAVGLQLVGLSLRGHHDAAGFVAAFSGSHRYILDYLTEEVLDRIAVLADSGYQGSRHARVPYKKRKGGKLLDSEKQANHAHARLYAPGERANTQLKSWNILRKARCCPPAIGKLAKAIHVLQTQEAA